jgi:hypothetical protein
MFIENKYKTWHDNIISKAKLRTEKRIYEIHHIIPKCLKGSNDKSNLVKLTPKEHYIVHMLLCKFTKGYARHKMIFAFQAMANIKSKNRTYKVNSKTAELLKLEFRKLLTGRKLSKKTLAKLSKIRKGRKLTEEHKRKIGLAGLGRKVSKETILKITSKTKGKKRTKEFKERMREIGKKRTFSKETRQKISLSLIGNKKALGLKHSEETKNRIRNANKGNKHTLGMICINKNGKTIMIQKDQKEKYLDMGYKLGKLRSCFRRSA